MKIAIVGKMRSGKDTVAELIKEKGFSTIAFADGITEVIEKYFPESMIDGKPRKHYQQIGQSMRELDPFVWIKYLDKRITDKENIIVTDCRQKNEEEYLRSKGFYIIKVVASDEIRMRRIVEAGDIYSPDQFYHDTEIQVGKITGDFLIFNEGTLDELKTEVDLILAFLRAYETLGGTENEN